MRSSGFSQRMLSQQAVRAKQTVVRKLSQCLLDDKKLNNGKTVKAALSFILYERNTMKRKITLILLCTLLFTACGKDSSSHVDEDGSSESSSITSKQEDKDSTDSGAWGGEFKGTDSDASTEKESDTAVDSKNDSENAVTSSADNRSGNNTDASGGTSSEAKKETTTTNGKTPETSDKQTVSTAQTDKTAKTSQKDSFELPLVPVV
ncbi:hypothetical protein [Ruminococcus sp. FC2018]|uniref:hypothetical protein n=1 Tax=Ruminococcus sp. FC2018 TaxID=1410617 RepID=UPI0012DF6612|nr:hypothetical protein [Ruminococcus sp. FC2018]